jgi:hypothetical protein
MAKKTISGFIVYRTAEYWDDEDRYVFRNVRPEGTDREVTVFPHSFEVDVPDNFDPRPQQLAALDEKIASVRAEFTARITELQEQKARLLCIENSPTAQAQ